jgi:D-beta-D-heptose 7-phosphate kinase/D-beta-D-heptose 1-phosphate adenosyltransferase
VVVFDAPTPLDMIVQLNPDVLIKGADYSIDSIVGAKEVLARGGRVLTCDLVPGKSTTRVVQTLRGAAGAPR